MSSKEETQEEDQTALPQSTASTVEEELFPSSNSSGDPVIRIDRLRREWMKKRNIPEEENISPSLEIPVLPEDFVRKMQGLRGGAPLRERRPKDFIQELPLKVKVVLWLQHNGMAVIGGVTVASLLYFFYRYLSSGKIPKIEDKSLTEE